MLDLISHVVKISAHRDRTEINGAMVNALLTLFHPQTVSIYRCYANNKKTVVFACAGFGEHGRFVRNAYQPDPHFCRPIERDRLLKQCFKERSACFEFVDDGSHRIIFPVNHRNQPLYLIELKLSEEFPADQRIVLMGLIEYFGNHLALLDYGETDTLTGLANRKTFDKHLFELLGRAQDDASHPPTGNHTPLRRKSKGANSSHWLAVCDIDHFKRVNDNFGHLIGDEVLIMVGQVMQQSFRLNDQLFRFGGEEFIALLQPATEVDASAALERFRQSIESTSFSRVGHITISAGLSRLLPYDTPTDVIDRADEALYYAKRNGRNQIACYENLIEKRKLMAKPAPTGEVELF
jgi:diguanylate cyclase (GGDEF)-like protein